MGPHCCAICCTYGAALLNGTGTPYLALCNVCLTAVTDGPGDDRSSHSGDADDDYDWDWDKCDSCGINPPADELGGTLCWNCFSESRD